MISYIDTREVEGIANDLSLATDELEAEFNNLFKRFSKVTTITKEWVGGRAEFYFATVAEDKRVYDELIAELRMIANELKTEAINADNYIKMNNTEN